MSVVTCRVRPNGYTIAADSITVRGWTQRTDKRSFSKLVGVGDLVIGGCGTTEELSLFQLFAETHQPGAATEGAILTLMSEFATWKKARIDQPGLENHYLLGWEDGVFSVQGWHVERVRSYEAIGAGMDYALAALYLGRTAEVAVQTAIDLCVYCEGPVQTIRRRC